MLQYTHLHMYTTNAYSMNIILSNYYTPGFVIEVVRLSKTTKNRHGQQNMNLWNTLVVRTDNHVYPQNNFATEHANITPYRDTRQSSVRDRVNLNHVYCHLRLTVDNAVW